MWLLKACSLEGFILRNEHFWVLFDSVFRWLVFWDRISLCRSWNSLCRPHWSWTQNSACLCLESAGIKGTYHHCLAVPHPPLFRLICFYFLFLSAYLCECMLTVNMPGKGFCPLELQTVMNCHIRDGNWTQVFLASSQFSEVLHHLPASALFVLISRKSA